MKLNQTILNIAFVFLTTSFCQAINTTIIIQNIKEERQFEKSFKERYSGDKYNYEGKEFVSSTQFESGEYSDYENSELNIDEINNKEQTFFNSGPLNLLFYGLLILVVLFILYSLVTKDGAFMFSKRKHKSLIISDEITSKNIENTDINTLIQKAEYDNNYRLAIRYYYLLTLKTLALKKVITFEDDKTNTEYLNELHNKSFYKNFAYTSYLYNYIWYGKFPINTEKYNSAKHNFVALLKEVDL